ncbi:MAG: hypothetical protein DI580_00770 [Cutibacterium acnes]|nr:MAG: hypothetical protein DI580_00770 [Cutibacterium acnes]
MPPVDVRARAAGQSCRTVQTIAKTGQKTSTIDVESGYPPRLKLTSCTITQICELATHDEPLSSYCA